MSEFKALIFLCFLIGIFGNSFSQDNIRKGKFHFEIGPEFRITPAYRPGPLNDEAIYTNPDMQNSGVALNVGVNYFFTNRLSAGFNSSFRYDLITNGVDFGDGISNSQNDIIFGYHFNLEYYLQVFRKGELALELGVSLLNRNTSFSVTETIFDNDGERIGTFVSTFDFSYGANKISVAYSIGKSKFRLGTYVTNNSGYFQETTTFWVPFISYSYDFAKL